MLSTTGLTSNIGNAGLDTTSQLARLQHQLSDCVNCATANTTAGKAKIQSISDQIGAIKERQQHAQQNTVNQTPNAQTSPQFQRDANNHPIPGAAVGGTINIAV
ncbi:hypothetical protein [Sulfuriferula nivalis]|uniref:Uncharacterized protein n=1 Tax=Sulfuriferula nivalis TaxID=2675298 RepID=A0A809RKK9_9PROT|nr:hypothetical protein [Sulfuriferula nivalis]BBP02106.1 hypothetical protein SFSGTM_28140 [Sulfuriferula nivalis]